MKGKRLCLFIVLALRILCSAGELGASLYPHFDDNPYLDDETRRSAAPYLLPLDHPIKPAVDEIFLRSRVVDDERTLKDAGFEIIAAMPGSFVIVARHPAIPGYVFKLYLDSESRCKDGIPNHLWLIRRCIGAAFIRNFIERKKIRYFTVPDKWLYILPWQHPSFGPSRSPLILIATDMQLVSEEATRMAWKTHVSRRHLKELYMILKRGHGSKRIVENIPYTKQDMFAFTDTEYPIRKIRLSKVKPFFSDEMQDYWERLTR